MTTKRSEGESPANRDKAGARLLALFLDSGDVPDFVNEHPDVLRIALAVHKAEAEAAGQ